MGSQFAVIYDLIIAVVLVLAVFGGVRKGFVSTVVGMAAVFLGFFCALAICTPAAELVYSSAVEKPVSEAVSKALDESMGSLSIGGLSDIDYDKITISGTPVNEIKLNDEGNGKIVLDLSDVGMSGSGIENADLSGFGFSTNEDFSSINGKSAQFTISEIDKNGIGRLVTAQVIAVRIQDSSIFTMLNDYTTAVGNAVPMLFGSMAEDISNGELSALRSLVITMMNTSSSVKTAVVDNIVRPTFMAVMRTIFFVLIFAIVTAVLEIVASALKIVNKIPVIGSFNGFLGGCAGLVKGVFTIFVICIIVRFVVTLTSDEVILINESAINATHIFRFFYDFDLLNFIT